MVAMSAAERVRLSRWVNKVEELADSLLDLLTDAPEPLPRSPVIKPELVEQLAQYAARDDLEDDDEIQNVRFLQLGNGHQSGNRSKALKAAAALLDGVTPINSNTVEVEGYGAIHFAAYTHPKGAMISSPQMEDATFGGADWHAKKKILMFRDVGDGRCITYVCDIESLFPLRTIGQHGVTWENVRDVASKIDVIRSADAIKAVGG